MGEATSATPVNGQVGAEGIVGEDAGQAKYRLRYKVT